MFTRSDWPETGLSRAISDDRPAALGQPDWLDETRIGPLLLRWVATTDAFESELYHLPVVSARLELEAQEAATLECVDDTVRDACVCWIQGRLASVPWRECYLLAKVVRGDLLHDALARNGFEDVERRSLYWTRLHDVADACPGSPGELRFVRMADVDADARRRYGDEMLEICSEAFEQGHSRHFRDPFLLERARGLDYIRAAMQLNLERVDPGFLLLVIEAASDRLAGFSVVGTKRGLNAETFTQLLTAVRSRYRGRRAYQGLTALLKRILPPDGVLLNATHADNAAMAAAYRRSGRTHLSDTVVLRRVFGPSGSRS